MSTCLRFVERVTRFFDTVKPLVYTREGVDCCNGCMWEAKQDDAQRRPWAIMYSQQARDLMFGGRDLHLQYAYSICEDCDSRQPPYNDQFRRFMDYVQSTLLHVGFRPAEFTIPSDDGHTIVLHQGVARLASVEQSAIDASSVVSMAVRLHFTRDTQRRRELRHQLLEVYRRLPRTARSLSRDAARVIVTSYANAQEQVGEREEPRPLERYQ